MHAESLLECHAVDVTLLLSSLWEDKEEARGQYFFRSPGAHQSNKGMEEGSVQLETMGIPRPTVA